MQSSMTPDSRANSSSQVPKRWRARRAAMNDLETCANELGHLARGVGIARFALWRTGALATVALLLLAARRLRRRKSPRCSEPGLAFVRSNCARCPLDRQGKPQPARDRAAVPRSPQALSDRESQEAFAEGIQTGHQNMPEFRLEPDQIGDVIAYLKTLEK